MIRLHAKKISAAMVLGLLMAASLAWAEEVEEDDRKAKAQALFERYVSLGDAFDPAAADLYGTRQ